LDIYDTVEEPSLIQFSFPIYKTILSVLFLCSHVIGDYICCMLSVVFWLFWVINLGETKPIEVYGSRAKGTFWDPFGNRKFGLVWNG
jgi:hypothetical protein